jgi:peptidylprolyl isomerase
MPPVSYGDTVRIHYRGRTSSGSIFDDTAGKSPLEFTVGKGQVISGLEEEVVGMMPGERKIARLEPRKAFGLYRDELIQTIDRKQCPDTFRPRVGEHYELRLPGRQSGLAVTVTRVTDSQLTLDANHPLAGQSVVFEIVLMEIVGTPGAKQRPRERSHAEPESR